MSEDEIDNKTESLGTFLRDTRKKHNISLTDAHNETRLSLPILKSIESNDFENMPAEAFSRGFYVLYAKYLKLDPEEILGRYLDARGILPNPLKKQSKPPVSNSEQFSSYAAPPNVSPRAGLVVFTLLFLVIIAGTCWYAGWNPVSYIITQLSPPQENVVLPSQPLAKETAEAEEAETKEAAIVETVVPVAETTGYEADTVEATAAAPYNLQLTFQSAGTLTVTLDDDFSMDRDYVIGQTLQWGVQKAIILDMPEAIEVTMKLNGIEIPLPEPTNGRRVLSIPEDFLN